MPPAGGFACSEGGVGWGWTWESEAERQRRQGMGTFSLTPKRRGGRGLSQRPGRRKELAKQSRKDRKKESKAICCQSIVKKVFQEAPTLEDKQKPASWREEKRKAKRTGSPQPRGQRAWSQFLVVEPRLLHAVQRSQKKMKEKKLNCYGKMLTMYFD